MDAEELYVDIKSAADYLGCGFRNLGDIQVTLLGNHLCLQANGKTCLISIPQKEDE